jgi:hypothetical protein
VKNRAEHGGGSEKPGFGVEKWLVKPSEQKEILRGHASRAKQNTNH